MQRDQRHRKRPRPFFAVIGTIVVNEMPASHACAATPFGRTVGFKFHLFLREERADMTGANPALSHRLRPVLAAICLGATSILMSAPVSAPALARGPDGIADVAEKVIDA